MWGTSMGSHDPFKPQPTTYVTRCEFELHRAEMEETHRHHNELCEKNIEAIAKLTESTQGLVDAWTTASNLQKFVKWISGLAVVGTTIAWLIKNF